MPTSTRSNLTPELAAALEEAFAENVLSEVQDLRRKRKALRILETADEDSTIEDRVRRKILDDKTAQAYREATEPPAPPFDAATLTDILARPPEPPMRAEGLIPWSGSALVVAQRKTGKTTLLLNYARALITGEPFLGQFPVLPLAEGERVAYLNYEVSGAQLGRWAADTGVDPDRIFLVNLRGRRNPLGRTDDRAQLAELLAQQNVKSVIVDPFGRAYTGDSQNDNGEVQAFLVDLEQFVRTEVGALDLMLATHAGWDGERTRGASALEDWGDVIITLTKNDDDQRFMKAIGRDVDIEEDQLSFDTLTRTLSRNGEGARAGKGRSLAKIEALARLAADVVTASPGCSRAGVRRALAEQPNAPVIPSGGSGEDLMTDILKRAEGMRLIRRETAGNGRPHAFYPVEITDTTPTTPDHSPSTPGAVTNHHHSPTLKGVVVGAVEHATCLHCGKDLADDLASAPRLTRCRRCRHLIDGSERNAVIADGPSGQQLTVDPTTGEVI